MSNVDSMQLYSIAIEFHRNRKKIVRNHEKAVEIMINASRQKENSINKQVAQRHQEASGSLPQLFAVVSRLDMDRAASPIGDVVP